MKRFQKGLAFALVAMMMLAAMPALSEAVTEGPHGLKYAKDQTLHLVYTTEATTLCAFAASGSANDWQAVSNCVEGLVTVDKYGNYVPGMAESWEISDDGTVYTFKLRQGQQWVDHTGKEMGPITAADYVAVAEYTCDPAKASSNAYYYENAIKGAAEFLKGETSDFSTVGFKAVDDYTLELTLTQPIPYFISQCGSYMGAYAPLLAELDEGYGVDNESMYYNGAYIMTEFSPQYRRVYEKNASYYNADETYIEKVIMSYNAEAATLAPELFLRGETDTADISTAILDEWKKNPDTKDIVVPGLPDPVYMYVYGFNYDPQFDAQYEPDNWRLAVNNENFRQSLYWGLNRYKALLVQDPYNPQLQQTNTVVPVGWCSVDGVDYTEIGALKEITDRPDNSFDEAKALEYKAKAVEELTAAGATFPIKILMPYNPTLVSWEMEVQVVKQQLTDLLGTDYIECIIEAGPSTGFLAEVRRTGKFAFMKLNNGSNYDDPISRIPPFDKGNNWTFLDKAQGEDIEALVAEYYALTDAAKAVPLKNMERYEKFAEAEAFLLNHAMTIPFCQDTDGYFVAKYNPFERPHNTDRLWRGMRVLEEPLTEAQFLALYADWVIEKAASIAE